MSEYNPLRVFTVDPHFQFRLRCCMIRSAVRPVSGAGQRNHTVPADCRLGNFQQRSPVREVFRQKRRCAFPAAAEAFPPHCRQMKLRPYHSLPSDRLCTNRPLGEWRLSLRMASAIRWTLRVRGSALRAGGRQKRQACAQKFDGWLFHIWNSSMAVIGTALPIPP